MIDEAGEKVGNEYPEIIGGKSKEVGELFFTARNKDRHFVIVDKKGKEIGDEYRAVYDSIDIQGENYFIVKDEDSYLSVVDGKGETRFDDPNYKSIRFIGENDQGPLICAEDYYKSVLLDENGDRVLETRGDIFSVRNSDDSPVLIVRDFSNSEDYLLASTGEQITPKFSKISPPNFIGEKIVFSAEQQHGDPVIIDNEGRTLYEGGRDNFIGEIIEVAGEMVFMAERPDGREVIKDTSGQEITDSYGYIGRMVDVGGKLVFVAQKENGKYAVIDSEGNQISENTLALERLWNHEGKLYYESMKKPGEWSIIDEEGVQIGDPVGEIILDGHKSPFPYRGENKLTGKWVVVNEQGEDITAGKDYEIESTLYNVDGKTAFIGRKKNDSYVVAYEKGDSLENTEEYDKIIKLKKVGNTLHLIAQKGKEIIKEVISM